MTLRFKTALLVVAAIGLTAMSADASNGWNGHRKVSRQRPNDLFYNHYVGPTPSGAAAQMYVAPQPVPASMGHTYTTYQPFMPHEFMYRHNRSYWTHHAGSGWTRTNVRYHTSGNLIQAANFGLFDDTKLGWLHGANFFDHLDVLQAFDY